MEERDIIIETDKSCGPMIAWKFEVTRQDKTKKPASLALCCGQNGALLSHHIGTSRANSYGARATALCVNYVISNVVGKLGDQFVATSVIL